MIMVDKKNRSLVLSLSQQQSSNNNHGSIAIGSINDTTNIANTNNTINSNDYIANTSNNISNPKSSSSNNSSNNATNKANNNQSVKRKRLTQACDVCRKKKVKCSGEKPSCNNCTRLNLNCTYLPSPRKRGPRVGLVESLERRLQQMEKLLQPLKEQGIVVGGPNNNKNFNQEQQQQQQQQQQQLQQLQFISQDPNSNNNVSKSNNDFVPSQINLRSPPLSSSSSAYNNNNNNDQEFINAFSNSQPQLNNINNNINNINNNNNSLQSPLQRPPSPSSSSSSSSSTTSSPLIESNELKTEIKEEDDVLIYFGKTSAKPGFIPKKETICGDADDNDIMHTTTTNSSENSSESSGSSNNNSIENSPNININNYNYILNNNNVSMPMTKTILFRPSLDMDTVEHLASCYFRYIDNQMPLLHKSTFMTQLRQNKVSPFLIYSLCAVAARFSDRQDIVRNPRYLSGEGYAEIASQMIFHTIDRPSPEAVQALLLLTMQSYGAMKGPRCWTYLGIAIRMAQEIGLHRIDESLANSYHSVVDDEMAFIKKETRRRTFWLGFTLDRFSACALGRPHMIQESDCDVRLPCKEEIWNLEHPFTSPKIDEFRKESKEKQGLLLKLAKCGLCACLVSVAALLGRACQYVNRSNSRNISQPWDPKSEYVQLEDDIKSWHSSISPHYDYSFEKLQKYMSNGTGVSFATMHIVYHATVVVLNRHSFSRSQQNDGVTPDVEFVKKSDAKCTEAARFASEIAKDIISIGCSNMFPFSVYGVFATASIHINDSFSNDKELAQNAKKYLKIDEQYLRDMESHWATAGKLATLMKEMIIAKESNNKSDIMPFYNYNNNESNGIYDNNNNIYNNFGGLGNDNIGIINNMVPMSLLSPRLLFSDQTFINGGGESWTSLLRSPYILTPRTLQRITNNNNNNNNNNNANNNNNSDMSGGGIDYFTQNSNVFGSQYPTITYENVPLIDASSSSTTGFIPPEFSSTNANTTRFPPLM